MWVLAAGPESGVTGWLAELAFVILYLISPLFSTQGFRVADRIDFAISPFMEGMLARRWGVRRQPHPFNARAVLALCHGQQ